MNQLKRKWKILTHDERTIKAKLLIALCVNLFFAFTLIFYTPLEMFLGNITDFSFSFHNATLTMGITALVFLVLATGLIPLLPGKFYDILLTSIFSFTLCCYIQGTFLNTTNSQLNGAAIQWHMFAKPALLNLALWIVLFFLPFVFYFFSKKIWKNALCFLSVLLVLMQSVGLISLIASTDVNQNNRTDYLSREGLYEVTEKENVVVFLVDFFDNDFVDEMLADDPDFFEPLTGFTRFTNNTSVYQQTLPSVAYLLSGHNWDPSTEYVYSYPRAAFSGDNMLKDIQNTGASIYFYVGDSASISENGLVFAENYVSDGSNETEVSLSPFGMIRTMINYSLYRDLPMALKAPFWFYTDDINTASVIGSGRYQMDDATFYSDFKAQGLTKGGDSKSFKLIHMMGGHYPYVINEQGLPESNSHGLPQWKGCFNIIYDYLDAMKQNGTFDNTTVIITSDHGCVYSTPQLEETGPTSVLFVKPAGADASATLQNSAAPVCQEDFHATVLKALGASEEVYSKYGRTYFDVAEDEDRTRYYHFYDLGEGPDDPMDYRVLLYTIQGDANDFSNWSEPELLHYQPKL